MAETALSTTRPETEAAFAGEKDRSFLWRRLHSLTGILPVGAFLLFHIYENLSALRGPEAYDEGIAKLADLLPVPYFYIVEVVVIALPILYHGLYGAYLSLEGKWNTGLYPYRRNWYYLLQRVSGLVALVFIIYHVVTLRIQVTMVGAGGGVPGHPGYVTFADVANAYSNNWVLAFYVLGVTASGFHLGNGINGFCWTWGIAVGERARRVVEGLGWLVFLATSIPMLHILWRFRQ